MDYILATNLPKQCLNQLEDDPDSSQILIRVPTGGLPWVHDRVSVGERRVGEMMICYDEIDSQFSSSCAHLEGPNPGIGGNDQ